jgi:tetratricopeptide (TPR) repeat protein
MRIIGITMRRVIAIASVVAACGVALGARQAAPLDLRAILDTYARGDYDAAVAKATGIADLGPLRLRFVQDTPVWVNADPARAEARRAAVASFLLELTAARLESDWGRFSDLIEWTCVQLRTAGPATEFERAWHSASHALAGRARARLWLLGAYAVLPHQKPFNVPPPKDQPPPARHLMHALERFPDDPRFQLSRVVAWTWGRDEEPIRNVRRRLDDDDPRQRARAPRLQAIVALEPLTSKPEVAAESWVRIGMVRYSLADHSGALRAFETAQPIATEPAMKYLAHFNAARALEGLSRPEDAIREYQNALAVVPGAESATVALASLQFMRDDRDTAVTLIDRVFNRPPSPPDPGRLIGYGSFMRWPELRAAMRNALPAYTGAPK